MQTLIQQLRDFSAKRDWEQFHSPKNLAMVLSVEVGELMEHFQWLTEAQSHDLNNETRGQVEEELADVMLYLIRLADQLGIDPVDAAQRKIKKNAEKYPVDKAKGNAAKYTDL